MKRVQGRDTLAMNNVIQETENYDIFKRLPGNRAVHEGLVQQLMESFSEKPQLMIARPILVNEKMQIVDGQHRKTAAERLGKRIYYMVVPGLTTTDARLLNALQKNWTLMDYAQSFAEEGRPDYLRFMELRKEFPIPPAVMLEYTTASGTRHDAVRHAFRIGNYEPQDEDITMSFLNDLRSFQPYLASWYDNGFAKAALRLFKMVDYDHDRMLKKLETYGPLIHRGAAADYLRDMEVIYNKGVSIGNHVRFL